MIKNILLSISLVLVSVQYICAQDIYVQGEDKNKIYHMVDERASFPGGPQRMMEFTEKNLRYPAECAKDGLGGRMIVSFVVEANGKISNINVDTKIDPRIDAEAVRLVKSMPRWIPGKINGKKVRTANSVMLYFSPN